MKRTFSATIIMIALAAVPAWSAQENFRNYRGVRSLGMGGVVTTTGVYDEALFGGNPAMHLEAEAWKLSILNLTAEVNSNLINDISKVTKAQSSSGSGTLTTISESGLVGNNEHQRISDVMGFYSPHFFGDNMAFAVGILINEQANLQLHNDTVLEAQAYLDVGPGVGIARKFLEGDLNVGVNARAIYRLAGDKALAATSFLTGQKIGLKDIGGQGAGIDGDIGAYYRIPLELPIVKLSAGASLNNVMASKYNTLGKDLIKGVPAGPPGNDRTAALGARVDFDDFTVLTKNVVAVEWQEIGSTKKLSSFWKKFHLGGETRLISFLRLRAGFNQGYPGGGVGINLPILKIDLATYGEEIGPNAGELEDRRYVARIGIEL